VDRIAAAAGVDTVYAPPATVLWHDLQFQMPTECLLTVVFPQKVQTYLACWVISIFLTCFRREAPYLVPYLPVTPTFFVRTVLFSHTTNSEPETKDENAGSVSLKILFLLLLLLLILLGLGSLLVIIRLLSGLLGLTAGVDSLGAS